MLKRRFPRLYWRIGEVSQLTGIPQKTLRGWEHEFAQLRPRRDASGVRVYRERDFRLVLLLQTMIEKHGQAIAEVRSFLEDDPAGADQALEGVDLDTVIRTRRRAAPPSGDEGPSVGEVQERDALAEPDEPNPWDDAALAGLGGDASELSTAPADAPGSEERTTTFVPAETDSVVTQDAPLQPQRSDTAEEVSDRTHPAKANEPLPAWAVEELLALRKELVALVRMIETLAEELPNSGDSSQPKDG